MHGPPRPPASPLPVRHAEKDDLLEHLIINLYLALFYFSYNLQAILINK